MTPKDRTKKNCPSHRLTRELHALRQAFREPGVYSVVTPTGERTTLFVLSRKPWRFRRVEPRLVPHAEAPGGAE